MTDNKVVGSTAARPKPPNAGKGRVKGVPNKTTVAIKQAIMSVYGDLQKEAGGGDAHFKAWAEGNQTEFYKIASKLIPLQLTGDDDGPVRFVLSKTDEQL